MQFVLLSISLWVSATMAYPFPVVRRSMSYPALRRNELYGQETFADRSLYDVPATRSAPSLPRASWPFLNDYVLSRGPQPAAPMAYGVPGDAIWTDALLRFDEAAGRMSENKPQEVVAQLLRRQEPYAEAIRPLAPNVDYGLEDDDEYDTNTGDFVPEITPAELSPEMLGYGNQFQAGIPEEEAPVYDTVRMIPQPVVMQTPEESGTVYRESILPYLLMSALENEGVRVRRPQASVLPESSQFGEIKTEIQGPPETYSASGNSNRNNNNVDNQKQSPATPAESLETSKRTKPASEKPSDSVAPTQPPVTHVVTEAATIQTTAEPLPKLSQFHRGQEEVAMLRPPSDNHRFSKGLSALSWPKELEEDDTEEQKRQLRELPMEIGNLKSTDIMAPVAHSPRKWPAALDEVDDWLADQLDQLKTRPER